MTEFNARETKNKGGIEFFGFPVLVIFDIGFSVFAVKIFGFLVLVSTAVFGFSLLCYSTVLDFII